MFTSLFIDADYTSSTWMTVDKLKPARFGYIEFIIKCVETNIWDRVVAGVRIEIFGRGKF